MKPTVHVFHRGKSNLVQVAEVVDTAVAVGFLYFCKTNVSV